MVKRSEEHERALGERLAVIESRLEDVIGRLVEIREYVPARMVEQSERLAGLERAGRSLAWLVGALGGGLASGFIAHVLGG
jgi:hypothetical protein